MVVLSFFTKYPAALIVPVMILYFMAKTDFIENFKKYFKNIFGGIIAGAITSIPFFAYYFIYNIPLGFLNQAGEVSSRTSTSVTHGGVPVGNDLFFYVKDIIYNISSTRYFIGIIIVAVAVMGLILMMYLFQGKLRNSFSENKNKSIRIFKWEFSAKLLYLSLAVSVILMLFSFFTASLFSFIYSEIILFTGLYLFAYSLTKIIKLQENVDDIKLSTYPYLVMNITMLGLFLSYFVFFSAHLTKADRYFTSMAPGFIFIITFACEMLISKIKGFEFKNVNLKYLIPILMMFLMLIVAGFYFAGDKNDSLVLAEQNAADWISDKEGVIFSERGPIYTWYLQKEVGTSKYPTDPERLNKELLENNVTWYIGLEDLNLTDYSKVKDYKLTFIYERN